jgi:hypothetical protein
MGTSIHESDSGYTRIPFELPGGFGAVKQWQSDNEIALTYTLLDFGRRASVSEQTREELIAANFSSNRTIQDVVFGVEQTFYAFDAVEAAVEAARQNLECGVARADLRLPCGEVRTRSARLGNQRFDIAAESFRDRFIIERLNLEGCVGCNSERDREIGLSIAQKLIGIGKIEA